MFQSRLPKAHWGYVPVRLAVVVCAIAGILLAVAVGIGVQYERHRTLSSGAASGEAQWFTLPGLGWQDSLKAGLALLVVAVVAIVLLIAFQNYRTASHAFEQARSLMRNVLQSIPTGVMTIGSDGVITSVNSAAERLLGLRASALVGRKVEELREVPPELAGWVGSARAGERLVHESDLAWRVDEDRRAVVRASASQLRGESGEAEGLVILLRDITEVSRLELQLRRADKLAALGTLAAGVAHEVKNPLHALTLNLHLLKHELGRLERQWSEEAKGYLDVLESELRRIHRIVDNFLRFAKPSVPEVKPVALNALVERVVSLVAFESADHGVQIETEFDPAVETVPGDEGQLSQVFLNLAINALQAMPSGGVLTVRTRRRGPWVEVAVTDTGEGISREVLPHVFDPYFTTRSGGVGLGLAIAHRIIEGHQGTIDIDSEVGRGTAMVVRLPLELTGKTATGS